MPLILLGGAFDDPLLLLVACAPFAALPLAAVAFLCGGLGRYGAGLVLGTVALALSAPAALLSLRDPLFAGLPLLAALLGVLGGGATALIGLVGIVGRWPRARDPEV